MVLPPTSQDLLQTGRWDLHVERELGGEGQRTHGLGDTRDAGLGRWAGDRTDDATRRGFGRVECGRLLSMLVRQKYTGECGWAHGLDTQRRGACWSGSAFEKGLEGCGSHSELLGGGY